MIRIDGSYGEGGGQILRSAIALSCITGEGVEIFNIRANRPNPGLKAQHLKGIEVAKIISNADVQGLRIGSTRITFKPKSIKSRNLKVDIGTAGSITLLFQTVLPPLLFSHEEIEIDVIGGTDVEWSPSIDYFRFVTSKALKELGADFEVRVLKRGYFPEGGGRVVLSVAPSEMKGMSFEEERCLSVGGISHCSNLPEHVAVRQADAAEKLLNENGYKAEIRIERQKGRSTGSGITLFCGYKGSVSLGKRGKPAEKVGREAGFGILEELKSSGAFDRHLADQLMIPALISKGVTEYTTTEITMHTKSNAYVINSFIDGSVRIEDNLIKIFGI